MSGIKRLSEEEIANIMKLISSGVPYKYAVMSQGFSEEAFYKWRNRGEEVIKKQDEHYDAYGEELKLTKYETLLVKFVHEFKKARLRAISRNVVIINKAAEEQWQAAAWWLERVCPNEFGRRERHDVNHSGQIDAKLSLAPVEMTKQEKLEMADKYKQIVESEKSE